MARELHVTRETLEQKRKQVRKVMGTLGEDGLGQMLDLENFHYFWCHCNDEGDSLAVKKLEALGYHKYEVPDGAVITGKCEQQGDHLFSRADDKTNRILLEIPMDDWLLIEAIRAEDQGGPPVSKSFGVVEEGQETETQSMTSVSGSKVRERKITSSTVKIN